MKRYNSILSQTPKLRVATSHSQVSFFNSNGRQISKSPTLTHLKSEKSHNEFDRYFNKQLDKVNTSLFKEEQQKPKKILRIETSPRKTSPTTRERPQTTTSKPLQEKLQPIPVQPKTKHSIDLVSGELGDAKKKIEMLECDIQKILAQKTLMQTQYNEKIEVAVQVNEYLRQQLESHQSKQQRKNYFPNDELETLKSNKQLLQSILDEAQQFSQQIAEKKAQMEQQEVLHEIRRLFPHAKLTQIPECIKELQDVQQQPPASPQPFIIRQRHPQHDVVNVQEELETRKKKYTALKDLTKTLSQLISRLLEVLSRTHIIDHDNQTEQQVKELCRHLTELKVVKITGPLEFRPPPAHNHNQGTQDLAKQVQVKEQLIKELNQRIDDQKLAREREQKRANAELKEHKQQLEKTLQSHEKMYKQMQHDHQTAIVDHGREKQRCEALEEKNKELYKKIHSLQEQLTHSHSRPDNDDSDLLKTQNQYLGEMVKGLRSELESSQEEKFRHLMKLQLIEQQLHDIEEQNKLSKDDVKSQSSNDSQNSQIEHLEEQLAQMNEAMEKLTKENETLQDQVKELRKRVRDSASTKLRQSTLVRSTKSFWDMEIMALNNSLLSLVNEKWSFTFRNTEDEWMPYTEQIAVFSFETHTIQKFIDMSFNFIEWRPEIYQSLSRRDTCYFKLQKQNNNQFLLMAKLLNYFPVQAFQQVSSTTRDEMALNEFWIRYALSQQGVLVFTCSKLGLEEMQFINYLNQLHEIGKCKLIICVLRQKPMDKDEALMGPIRLLGIPEVPLEQPSHIAKQIWCASYLSKITVALETQFHRHEKEEFNMVEQLRSFMLREHSQFFNAKSEEPDFQMVQHENSFELTLLLQKQPGSYKLQPVRQNEYFIEPVLMARLDQQVNQVKLNISLPEGELKKVKVLPTTMTIYIKVTLQMKGVTQKLYFQQFVPKGMLLRYEQYQTSQNNLLLMFAKE